jgi:hypothetical protein
MNRLAVTIVDILGVLVPGVVLLAGCALAPVPIAPISATGNMIPGLQSLVANSWVVGGGCLVAAYILGFLLRLVSIRLMNMLTHRFWSGRLEKEAKALEEVFDSALANPALSRSLKELSGGYPPRDPGRYAPYFHFARRLVRTNPQMWAEAERLEAEVRLAAGLFIPFLVVSLVVIWRWFASKPAPWTFAAASAAGAATVLAAFPSRRCREVLYDQMLALTILLYPPTGTADR